jgi:hypothetical protein
MSMQPYGEPAVSARAAGVGCGLADDAEELADWGFRVTALDASEELVVWCRDRFIGSAVTYVIADPENLPKQLLGTFDFVYEGGMLLSLASSLRAQAIHGLAELLAPNGLLLVICPGSEESRAGQIAKGELSILETQLSIVAFEDFFDHEEPPVRRFRALYRRGALGTGPAGAG